MVQAPFAEGLLGFPRFRARAPAIANAPEVRGASAAPSSPLPSSRALLKLLWLLSLPTHHAVPNWHTSNPSGALVGSLPSSQGFLTRAHLCLTAPVNNLWCGVPWCGVGCWPVVWYGVFPWDVVPCVVSWCPLLWRNALCCVVMPCAVSWCVVLGCAGGVAGADGPGSGTLAWWSWGSAAEDRPGRPRPWQSWHDPAVSTLPLPPSSSSLLPPLFSLLPSLLSSPSSLIPPSLLLHSLSSFQLPASNSSACSCTAAVSSSCVRALAWAPWTGCVGA